MSSRFTTTCFDIASDYLDRLDPNVFADKYFFNSLKLEVKLLKIILVCVKKGRKSNKLDIWDSPSFRIENVGDSGNRSTFPTFCIGGPSIEKLSDAGFSIEIEIKSLLEYIMFFCTDAKELYSRFSCLSSLKNRYQLISDAIEPGMKRLRENIKFLWTDTKHLYISLLDQYPCPPGDQRRLMDLFDSFLEYFEYLSHGYVRGAIFSCQQSNEFHESLKSPRYFIINFISFATMQGVDQIRLTDLLIQLERVTVNIAYRICESWFDRGGYDKEERNKFHLEISQLIQKIMPVDADPQLREAYIHTLTASKLSRSCTCIFSGKKDGHTVAANFIDSLLSNLMDLLSSYTNLTLSVKFQMLKLQEGLVFLQILLRKQHKNFIPLDDELKDLIGVVLIDAGTVICSLSVDELKQGLSKETDIAFLHLLEVFKFIMAEVADFYPPTSLSSSSIGFPRTNELGSFDFLLENLKELASCEVDSIAFLKDQIHIVQEDLEFLRSFLGKIAEQRNQNEKLQGIWNRVVEVAWKVEFVIDSLMVGDNCSPMSLDAITEEIKSLKAEAREIYESLPNDIQARRITNTFTRMPSQVCVPTSNEFLVGVDKEAETIIKLLTRGSKHRDVVSIVGMPGLGKTSLANKIYHDPSINYHFHIRVWCTVSQVYSKKSLLCQILGCTDCNSNEDDLAEKLYKRLKGNRYLVVLDDVWEVEALNLLDHSFPDDKNGSRILFTSRFQNLTSDSKLHHLCLLNDEKCWELLQNKLFGKEFCPPTLRDIVMQIAKSCKGLPLTVVIVAGILATIKPDCWEDVANSLSSNTADVTKHCRETLELSYGHLPDYLKSCFVYFGAFPEDTDIPVRKLLWLWISEGFVQKNERKSLEKEAEEYMMDLIARNLVMVTGQRAIGGAKTCRVHDLLHEFCVKKVKEESFLHLLHIDNEFFPTALYNPQRLCIHSTPAESNDKRSLYFPHLRCLLFLGYRMLLTKDVSFIFRRFKLLRVLDVREVSLGYFPLEVVSLIHLRFLAIEIGSSSIPSGIANLSRLEIFIILTDGENVELPNTVWNMKKLRHLWSNRGFRFPTDNLEVSPDLHHLETLILAIDSNFEKIIGKLPSIRRLKCFDSGSEIPNVLVPGRLESLRIRGFLPRFDSPSNLKKLTLESNWKPWHEISTIGSLLPNLQVLKLLDDSFVGDTWELKEGEFLNLRFLKLEFLNIRRWTASCDNFPPLQQLVIRHCISLESFPSFLGEIPTLEMIEVKYCRQSAINSLEQVQDEQKDMGNESLKIVF